VTVRPEEDLDAEEVRQRIRKRSSSRSIMDRRVSRERSLERERRQSREEGERERKRSRDEAVRRSSSKEPRQRDRSLSGNVDERLLGDDIPTERTASVKRSLSGRSSYSGRLSFRVSPNKQQVEDVPRVVRSPERDTSVSITRHIQSKVGQQRHSTYEKPKPPLPERPPRHQRASEPALFTSPPGERPAYMGSTTSSLARSASRGSDYGQVNMRPEWLLSKLTKSGTFLAMMQ
jgi:hypothetical protein